MIMLTLHPIIQLSATLLAFYVLVLGVARFRRLHLNQKTLFRWQRHVWLGTATLLLLLLGTVLDLVMVKISWLGFLITGNHGLRSFLIIPLILIGLFTGGYLNKQKNQRVFLPLIHGCTNLLLIILLVLQVFSGWQVYNTFVLGN